MVPAYVLIVDRCTAYTSFNKLLKLIWSKERYKLANVKILKMEKGSITMWWKGGKSVLGLVGNDCF